MWDQGLAPPNNRSPSHSPDSATAPHLSQHVLHSLSHQQLLLLLQHQSAELRIYREKELQNLAAAGPIQETSRNLRQGDESLENGRQETSPEAPNIGSSSPPVQQAARVHPDIRMILHDTVGMRVEQNPPRSSPAHITAGSAFTPGSGSDPSTASSAGNDPSIAWSNIQVPAGESGPRMAWSDSHVIDTQSMDRHEERKILLRSLKDCQSKSQEQEGKLKQARCQNHCLLTQFTATNMELERMKQSYEAERREKQSLANEVKQKDETIRKLTEELQQLKNSSHHHHVPLRVGIKRGRFFMSKASMLECLNCSEVFPSQDAALNSVCAHHPQAACKLPNKMVAEMREDFPEERRKQRYWPCCKAIGTSIPPPCYRGAHVLRQV